MSPILGPNFENFQGDVCYFPLGCQEENLQAEDIRNMPGYLGLISLKE